MACHVYSRKGVGMEAGPREITALLLLTTVRALLGAEVTGPINDVDWFKLRACQYGNLPGTWTQLPQVQGDARSCMDCDLEYV